MKEAIEEIRRLNKLDKSELIELVIKARAKLDRQCASSAFWTARLQAAITALVLDRIGDCNLTKYEYYVHLSDLEGPPDYDCTILTYEPEAREQEHEDLSAETPVIVQFVRTNDDA